MRLPRPGTVARKVFDAVAFEGFATAPEIALEKDVSAKHAAAALKSLAAAKWLRCTGEYPRLAGDRQGGDPTLMYELAIKIHRGRPYATSSPRCNRPVDKAMVTMELGRVTCQDCLTPLT